MIIVIIAGGSGTRLWPLSTPDKPKHVLRLTNQRSLLQNTYQRVKSLANDVYVVTEKSHAAITRRQLPKLPAKNFIVEPTRRGTASAILLALHTILKHHDVSEPAAFMHADHHITDTESFKLALATAAKAAKAENKVALIGVEPYYAATGFGYIKKGTSIKNGYRLPVYKVASFKEKPNLKQAQSYIASGRYLWNMGLFTAPINVFEANFKTYAHDLFKSYQSLKSAGDLNSVYRKFPNQAIDTALIEKTPRVIVVIGTFSWADIGSFHDLHTVSEHNKAGNVQIGRGRLVDTRNSYIRNHTKKPAIVIGLNNIVVINTTQGLLVCHRDYAQKVGETIRLYWDEQP